MTEIATTGTSFPPAPDDGHDRRSWTRTAVAPLALALVCFGYSLALGAGEASAAKQVTTYFGTESRTGTLGGEFNRTAGIAVNETGAGAGAAGDVYMADQRLNRIQRFARVDPGTPAIPADDTFEFVSAWGADVNREGTDYEVCTDPSNCKAGVASDGNGSLNRPQGLAIDQDTGLLYLSDRENARVNVYDGDGTFIRSFGFDVVAAGPGDAGAGYEICTAADGDLCKAGISGSGTGQISVPTADPNGSFDPNGIAISPADGSAATGTVFFADSENQRVNTYGLDGSGPDSFGSPATFGACCTIFNYKGPTQIAVDSRGIVYASDVVNNGEIKRYDTEDANGDGVGFLPPIGEPPLRSGERDAAETNGLAVEIDGDGPGPDRDVLHVGRTLYRAGGGGSVAPDAIIQQLGPTNEPGLGTPPSTADDESSVAYDEDGAEGRLSFFGTIAATSNGQVYVGLKAGVGQPASVLVLGEVVAPNTSIQSISDITATSASVDATINPNGGPDVSYSLEYSLDGSDWQRQPGATILGSQQSAQQVSVELDPGPFGLLPNTLHHVRIVATRPFNEPAVSPPETFTTAAVSPAVETAGSPIRTASTARFDGRLAPRGAATDYHFEYGSDGPCDANPCTALDPLPAGNGQKLRLVSQWASGLEPDTTYHFRLIASNAALESPTIGESMKLHTRDSDDPITSARVGPPGSDRAWEMVSEADTSGNHVSSGYAFSDEGDRAVYQVNGGTPDSSVGSSFNPQFAERGPEGWQTRQIYAPREQLTGPFWSGVSGAEDLAPFYARNYTLTGDAAFFRISADAEPELLYDGATPDDEAAVFASADGSRMLLLLQGTKNPSWPVDPGADQLYDLTSGTPEPASVLPDGELPSCGVSFFGIGGRGAYALPVETVPRAVGWVSSDGVNAFFPSAGNEDCEFEPQLYMRDLVEGESRLLSGPVLSGATCGAAFLKSVPGAAFFWTQSRLVADDATPENCEGLSSEDGDVYRASLSDGALQCVTCLSSSIAADVVVNKGSNSVRTDISVAADGSRVYFKSPNVLVPEAKPFGLYRVAVDGGDLAYVAPGQETGNTVSKAGENAEAGSALSADGSVLLFRANLDDLNQIEGADNGGTTQLYRYDDDERSLLCVSCPVDGSAPTSDVSGRLLDPNASKQAGANQTPLSVDGETVAFVTASRLAGEDENTVAGEDAVRGTDVYEWRDGRQLLITDGETEAESGGFAPQLSGVSPDGSSIFFQQAAVLTPDAIDPTRRLYVARIGGGFDLAEEETEECQGDQCQGDPRDPPPPVETDSAAERPGNPAVEAPAGCGRLERRVASLKKARKSAARKQRRLIGRAKRSSGAKAGHLRERAARQKAKKKTRGKKVRRTSRQLDACRGEGS